MKKLLLTIAVLSVSAMTVQAGDAETAAFNQLDVDQDGYISVVEGKASSLIESHFTKLDTNTDGQLTLAEFENSITK